MRFHGFRLQAVKREGRWEATVWPGQEDLGWPENRIARGRTLENCLRELQVMLDKWGLEADRRAEKRAEVSAGDKMMRSFG
jgi:hypothetical protein